LKRFDFKIAQCLSKNVVIEDRLEWIYPFQEWVAVPIKYDVSFCEHRVPWFLSLHAHVVIEEVLEDLVRVVVRFPYKKLLFFYDIIHGLICAYGMKDILDFWKQR
jgi:hypothetical protein